MIEKVKYNKNKNQFNLSDSGRHYIYKKSRADEVIGIDNWLMENNHDLVITFADTKNMVHHKVKVDTNNMATWFDGETNKGDWNTFVWDFPTDYGHVYIHARTNKCYFGDEILSAHRIDENHVAISVK